MSILMSVPFVSRMSLPRLLDFRRNPGRLLLVSLRSVVYLAVGGSTIWLGGGGVNLVDDGGRISPRHNAFFVGQDGSQFPTAYISPQPVRFIIEYDDVAENYTAISLVLGRGRIQAVPITLIDPSQPAGKMPARPRSNNVATSRSSIATAPTATQSPAQSGTGVFDKTSNTVNNANQQKKKAQSLWKSLQGAAQSH